MKMKRTFWTKKETQILKKYYPNEGKSCFVRLPGRTAEVVARKASYLHLIFKGVMHKSTGKVTRWTSDQDETLKKYYPSFGTTGCLAHNLFPDKTADAVRNRVRYFGLVFKGPKKLEDRLIGTTDEQRILRFAKKEPKTVLEVAEHLDRSPSSVRSLIAKLRQEHYNIQLLNEDKQVTLSADPAQGGHEVIDVEKYFGSSREVVFGIISDMHYGNVHSRHELIQLQYEIFKREGVEIVLHCGNMIDGELYLNRYELLAHGIDGQIQYLIKHTPKIKGITTYFVTGDDHEGWLAHNVGLNIGQKIQDDMESAGRYDWKYLGFLEADVQFKTRKGSTCVRIAHPGGGTAYAVSYTPQKIIESLQGGEKPHIFISGHYHKLGYWTIRNVETFLAGCFEDQTTFMRKKHIEAQLGAWIIRMTLSPNGTILKIVPCKYPYFDRKIYTVGADFNMPGLRLAEPLKKIQKPSVAF